MCDLCEVRCAARPIHAGMWSLFQVYGPPGAPGLFILTDEVDAVLGPSQLLHQELHVLLDGNSTGEGRVKEQEIVELLGMEKPLRSWCPALPRPPPTPNCYIHTDFNNSRDSSSTTALSQSCTTLSTKEIS